MIECNNCARRHCDIIDMFRNSKGMFKTFHLRQNCKQWIKPPIYKESLLMFTLGKYPQGIHDVLQEHHFVLKELAEFPWFKIRLRNT